MTKQIIHIWYRWILVEDYSKHLVKETTEGAKNILDFEFLELLKIVKIYKGSTLQEIVRNLKVTQDLQIRRLFNSECKRFVKENATRLLGERI